MPQCGSCALMSLKWSSALGPSILYRRRTTQHKMPDGLLHFQQTDGMMLCHGQHEVSHSSAPAFESEFRSIASLRWSKHGSMEFMARSLRKQIAVMVHEHYPPRQRSFWKVRHCRHRASGNLTMYYSYGHNPSIHTCKIQSNKT